MGDDIWGQAIDARGRPRRDYLYTDTCVREADFWA